MTRKKKIQQAKNALAERESLRKVLRAERALMDSLVTAVQEGCSNESLKKQVTDDFARYVLRQEMHYTAWWDLYERHWEELLAKLEAEDVND